MVYKRVFSYLRRIKKRTRESLSSPFLINIDLRTEIAPAVPLLASLWPPLFLVYALLCPVLAVP
jgi:hypothetical protein